MDTKSGDLLKRFGFLPTKKDSPTSTSRLNLPPSLALLAPTFPTFSALSHASEKPPAEHRRDGLFNSMLKDPQVLLQDLLASPQKYEDGVATLVQDLVGGRRKLEEISPSEMELLDRATIDFTQPARQQKLVVPPLTRKKTTRGRSGYPRSQKAPSLNGLEPYWWLD